MRDNTVFIHTPLGSVQGTSTPYNSGSIYTFYGIPYAEAPVGNLRWKDAAPKSSWEKPLDCTLPLTQQKSAYQWGTNLLAYFHTLNVSEDCLYLNITTPQTAPAAKLPVIVWFHGGGLFGGSGSEEVYNLPHLPGKGCVLVTVTTRLGAFGLLSADILGSTEGTPDAGNYIISDMLMALRWVRDNIGNFGGNPDNVTIAGESGGAQKVNALMAVPAAKGLFHRAIMQSGTSGAMSFADAKQFGNRLIEKLGVHTVEEARSIPPEAVVQAYNEMNVMLDFIVDQYYLPAAPMDAVQNGMYNGCNVIMGVNSGEISNLLMEIGGIPNYLTVLNRLTADGYDAFVYELDQVPATWRPLGFHCVHSLDIAYLFGEYENTDRYYDGGPWEQQFIFHDAGKRLDPAQFISPVMDESDRRMSRCIMNLWASFCRTGIPMAEEVVWRPWTITQQDYLLLSDTANTSPNMRTSFGDLT